MSDRVTVWLRRASLLALASAATPAVAQTAATAADDGLEEIVVTAQRRAENIQDVPVAVTALSGEELTRAGVVRIDEVASRVPSLFISTGNSVGTTRLNVRGVFSEPNNVGVGVSIPNYVDGVAQGPGRSLNVGLFDISAIEVLRGPQGTLFGRNSTGGAILIRTRQPELNAIGGYVEADYGNYDSGRLEGAINLSGTDTFALRIAGQLYDRDGYSFNTTLRKDQNDADSSGLRAQMLFKPSDALRITLRGDHFNDDSDGNAKDFGPNAAGGRNAAVGRDFRVASDANVRTTRKMTSGGIEVGYDLGGYNLVSLSSWGRFRYLNFDDVDFLPAPILATTSRVRQDQFSQELRVESPTDGPFSWVGGLYYFDEETSANNFAQGNFAIFGGAPNATTPISISTGSRETESYAAFFQGQYQLTEQFSVIAGLRYTKEESDGLRVQPPGRAALGIPPANLAASTDDSEVTGTAKLVFEPSDDIMTYVSYSRGFKGSAFNTNPGTDTDIVADPEFVDNYEAGIRSEWLDSRLRVNATAFYYQYKDLQRSSFVTPPILQFGNAGGLDGKGLELEVVSRPVAQFGFGGTLGLIDAEFTEFIEPNAAAANLKGNRPSRTPKVTGSLFADATYDGFERVNLILRGDYLHRGNAFTQDNNSPNSRLEAVDLFNLRFTIQDKNNGWSITAYGRNLFDKKYVDDITPQLLGQGVGLSMGAPRTYGATLRVNF